MHAKILLENIKQMGRLQDMRREGETIKIDLKSVGWVDVD
jgi:hypothetical protein